MSKHRGMRVHRLREAREVAKAAFVRQALGDAVICERCGATVHTWNDACTADLADPCPGFKRYDAAAVQFERANP